MAIWRILPKIAKFKTAKLKFSGGHNVIAVVAMSETPNKKKAKSVQMTHSPKIL